MEENKQDKLKRARATLSSLRDNIPQMSSLIPAKYVHEFHTGLDKLESVGIDVSEFRIPDSEVKPRTVASQYVGGRKVWSNEVIGVEKSFILTKLDNILSYLDSLTPEEPREIGFRTPDKK